MKNYNKSKLVVKKIVIVGSSGQIGSQLSFLLATMLRGSCSIVLLDKKENLHKSTQLQQNIYESGLFNFQNISCTTTNTTAFTNADFVFFCCSSKNLKSTEVQPKLQNFVTIQNYAKDLNKVCKSSTKVVVISNPCNTLALILLKNAPNLPPCNIHALSMLDHMRGRRFLSNFFHLPLPTFSKLVIWGNHSPTAVPDLSNIVFNNEFPQKVLDAQKKIIPFVQSRGAEITINRGNHPSCLSAVYAAFNLMNMMIGSHNEIFCSAMYSKNNPYGFDQDLVISGPVIRNVEGKYEWAQSVSPNSLLKNNIENSLQELICERDLYFSLMGSH